MIDNNNNKDKPAYKGKPFHGADKLLLHINQELNKKLKKLMSNFYDSLDESIIGMIKSSNSDSEYIQNLYLESLNSMRIHKLNVLSSFLYAIKNTFTLFENSEFNYFEDKVTKITETNNSVAKSIDKNDVDEKLVQNILIHKYETIYIDQLSAFQKRFSKLIASQLEPYFIPVSPFVLISSFAKSIRLLHLDIKFKLILYKHFDSHVISKINGLYNEINQYLNNNGIETGLENKIRSKPSKKIKSNVSSSKKKNKDRSTVLSILTTIQQKSLYQLTPVELKNNVLEELKQSNILDQAEHISRYDKDAINLITMIFQLMVGDRNIPMPIKSLLTKLQIPYFKAAIQDNALLNNKQHPAQILLDTISKASVGWQVKTDTRNIFFNTTHNLVDSILNKTHLDRDFFEVQLKSYKQFLKKNKNEFKPEQDRVEEKLKGRNRIVSSMKTVEAVISHKLENSKLPDLLRNVILGPWKNLLVLLLVRHSDTSEEYLLKANFIDDLIQIAKSNQYEVIIKKNIDVLCLEYTDGLKLVAYEGEGLLNKVNEFRQCLYKIHHIEASDMNENIHSPTDIIKDVDTLPDKSADVNLADHAITKNYSKVSERHTQPITIASQADDSIFENLSLQDKTLLTELEIGSWYQFKRKDKSSVKAQLSWTSPKTGMFIFVNSRGLKVAGKMPKDLIRELNDKTIIPINKR